MAFKMTLWVLGVMFVATMYNVVSAYSAMGDVNVQQKFEIIGILDDGNGDFPLPMRKPVQNAELALR